MSLSCGCAGSGAAVKSSWRLSQILQCRYPSRAKYKKQAKPDDKPHVAAQQGAYVRHLQDLYSSALSIPALYSAAAGSAIASTIFIWASVGALHGIS